jgi:hypothetical protein
VAQPIPIETYYDNECDPMWEAPEVITEEKKAVSAKPVKVRVSDRYATH